MFMTLSTVLHIGEISFVGEGNNEAAQVQNADALKKCKSLFLWIKNQHRQTKLI